ncbi:S-layer homology domain-containing protein [Ruminiclostridium hungatei]|uniref:S-layer homology domain-containing protein n=1 Tax=Ruminiclostridium hungatei TaxID=48256 RepID=UPI0013FD454E|nr:S-layer homology domain-containing protein [Ruminiclostridium hungatei]
MTRGEFISFLINALRLDTAGTDNFADVKSTDSCSKALGITKRLEIAKGTGNNKFNPKGLIIREDRAVLTLKAILLAEKTLAEGTSKDMTKYKDIAKVDKNAVNSSASRSDLS